MVITIDGPVASGKSSVARSLAQRLGFYYLNSGLLYRAAAYINGQVGGNLSSPDLTKITDFTYTYDNGEPQIIYKNKVITDKLYIDALSKMASKVSSLKSVRAALINMQRDLGREHDLVTDGRDCGSVIFPHADVKFYLTADVEIRAKRVLADTKRKKKEARLEDVIAQIEERDERDKNRDIAPLVIPDGARVVDNGAMSLEEAVTFFADEVKKRLS